MYSRIVHGALQQFYIYFRKKYNCALCLDHMKHIRFLRSNTLAACDNGYYKCVLTQCCVATALPFNEKPVVLIVN